MDTPQKIIRPNRMSDFTGYSLNRIYRMVRAGTFPKPIKLAADGYASGWLADEVLEWQRSRIAERDGTVA